MPGRFDLTLWEGADHRWQLQLLDAAGNPVDLTGATLTVGGTVPLDLVRVDDVQGRLDLVVGRAAVLPAQSRTRWDLWWSDPAQRRPLLTGVAIIERGLAHG